METQRAIAYAVVFFIGICASMFVWGASVARRDEMAHRLIVAERHCGDRLAYLSVDGKERVLCSSGSARAKR